MELLLDPTPPQLSIAILPSRAGGLLLELAAGLAARGPLLVLDGGNRFNAYPVARRLHSRQALTRLRVARAFTCFQMLALLQDAESDGPALLVLDPLATFNDENVPAPERRYTFRGCVEELIRLSRRRPVGVGLLSRSDPLELIDYLSRRVSRAGPSHIYRLEPEPVASSPQLRLL